MKTPRVSVLLPVFNAAATLTETLASIQAQSCEDFEVVGIDDGSEDESGDVLLEWSRRDGRFRALLADHGGIVAAPNRGLPWCRGEYVARMDADDRMHPERLEKQRAWLEADRSLSVVSCLVEIFPRAATGEGMLVYEAWLNGLVDSAAIEREFFIESPIAHPSAMMRREELVALGGYQDRGWPEDYDLWLSYRAAGRRFAQGAGGLALLARASAAGHARTEPLLCGELPPRQSALPLRRAAARAGRAGLMGGGQDRAGGSPNTWSAKAVLPTYLSILPPRKSAAPCGASR